jgi:hypothetical protein
MRIVAGVLEMMTLRQVEVIRAVMVRPGFDSHLITTLSRVGAVRGRCRK